MKLPARERNIGATFNMTPMIDIVFLLIIFFLVSSHLARQEVQFELDLPQAQTGEEVLTENNPRVTVNVRRDGSLLLGAEKVNNEELEERLDYEHQQIGNQIEVRVRSDRSVPYRFVEPVLLACARSGIWNVSFAVVQKE